MDGENGVAESVGKGDTRTQTVSGKRLKIHPKGSQLCLHCEASEYTLIYACVFGSVCVVVCTYVANATLCHPLSIRWQIAKRTCSCDIDK